MLCILKLIKPKYFSVEGEGIGKKKKASVVLGSLRKTYFKLYYL